MEPQFWHERWQRNETGWHQQEINAHLQDFWPQLRLPAGGAVFVPLCGKSRDLLWLRAHGHAVLGVESARSRCTSSSPRTGSPRRWRGSGCFERCEADGLTVLCGDFFALDATTLHGVAGVYDRASLIALPPEMRVRYARHLAQILPGQAAILLVTMEYDQQQMPGPPFAVHEDEVRRLYEPRYHVTRLFEKDIFAENPRFRERGLSALCEKVYRLTPDES